MKALILKLGLTASTGAVADHHANKAGMTLCTFDNDKDGSSSYYDGYTQKWPPYIAKVGAEAKKVGI